MAGTPTGASVRVGGAIGYVQSVEEFEIGISDSTISPKVYATAGTARENWDMAGLIAEIAYNGDESDSDTRTVSLSGNTITGCEVKNNATVTTGGLFGYNWYNTNVVLSSNTFSSANLLYTDATKLAALCYRATGYWQVASAGLDVDALTVADKSGVARASNAVTEFGFIVNKGYYVYTTTNSTDNPTAIYLEMQAANSYTLGSDGAGAGVSVPTMTSGVYDELVAYTSDNVLTNKSGVISYYTNNNGTLYMDASKCNSYQNIFNKTLGNEHSRYYYNYYQNKTSSADKWKVLKWSLSIYSADNISAQFVNPFGTSAVTLKVDLTNVSYYPVDIDAGTVVDIADMGTNSYLTFKNHHFEKSEAASVANGNTDNFTRSTLVKESQHYLMHTGLFRNVAGTINFIGAATFRGTVGSTSDYSGVFINGTLTGTVNTNSSKTITLGRGNTTITSADTLQMITTGGVKTNEGYLFINKISNSNTNSIYLISVTRSNTSFCSANFRITL